jgi:DNA topoisomerase VI subunit A
MGIGGKAIPSNMTKVTSMRSDATFVLLVEKVTEIIIKSNMYEYYLR